MRSSALVASMAYLEQLQCAIVNNIVPAAELFFLDTSAKWFLDKNNLPCKGGVRVRCMPSNLVSRKTIMRKEFSLSRLFWNVGPKHHKGMRAQSGGKGLFLFERKVCMHGYK